MQNRNKILAIILGIVALIVITLAAFTVDETEQVIITQLGKPVGEAITEPGIHFKIPFLQKANFFDKRFLEWDGDSKELVTKDKRYIYVDTYARWHITDPLLFFERVTNEKGAQTRLDDILDGETRNAVASHDLVELVRSTNRVPVIADTLSGVIDDSVFPTIEVGREKISEQIFNRASERTKEIGVELLDVQIKRLNYIEEVRLKVYERMITERKRIADQYRSEGQGQASKILGDKERELKRIQSEAYKTSQEIVGKADAQATKIYADAYNQSTSARDFYSFLQTLETYKTTFSDKDVLILSTDSDYYKFLENASGR